VLSFEVKLAPKATSVTSDDIERAEGATRALAVERQVPPWGLLITPHDAIDETAGARPGLVRVPNREVLAQQADSLLGLLDD
jgi:hypothetical protein